MTFIDDKFLAAVTDTGDPTDPIAFFKLSLANATASSALRLPLANSAITGSTENGVQVIMRCPVPWSIIWGGAGVPVPDPSAHSGSNPTQSCDDVPPDFPYKRFVPLNLFFRAIQSSGSTALLSISMSPPSGTAGA